MAVHTDTSETSGDVKFRMNTMRVPAHEGIYATLGKRLFDLLLVIAAAPIVLPLIAILSVLITIGGSRPLFFQERVGRGGRTFRMVKFKTMVDDAETVLANYLEENPEARAEWDAHQKLKNDPRITSLGRFLRKTSMDELPQFWNVFIGEMSIVGPRPMLETQRAMYPGDAYYRMRPGITGAWQISDRNDCEFSERAGFDTQYEQMISLGTDLKILTRTVGVVVRGTGY